MLTHMFQQSKTKMYRKRRLNQSLNQITVQQNLNIKHLVKIKTSECSTPLLNYNAT